MLAPPAIPVQAIVAALRDGYDLTIVDISFLPLGADLNTAAYRVIANDYLAYFVKLRLRDFSPVAVTVPAYLHSQGLRQIIAPLPTRSGDLWVRFADVHVVVYPFVESQDGYHIPMADHHWRELGAALRQLHTADWPPDLLGQIPAETFGPHGRELVTRFLDDAQGGGEQDQIALDLRALLQERREQIGDLVRRAERLASQLQAQPPAFCVCHSDLHAGNILIDGRGNLSIVDWDNPIRAPRERDLMFIGGGQGFLGHTAAEEERLFYAGYGEITIDPVALAYYRYERIIQDIAAFCEQIYAPADGGEDRAQALHYLKSNFVPEGALAVAYASDQT